MKRLRPVRRKMSWAAFERLPHRLGWKHEYWDGMARLRPGWTHVTFELDLAAREPSRQRGIRPVMPTDSPALRRPFLEAFALAPEYVGYPMAKFRAAAERYLAGYFGHVRGEPSPASVVAVVGGEIIGAALVKERAKGPLLDCIFVRPDHSQKGWATALAAHAVSGLTRRGGTVLYSSAMLANSISMSWHVRFGFRELPSLWVAQARAAHYAIERERLERLGRPEPEVSEVAGLASYWHAEERRLWDLGPQAFDAVHAVWDRPASR
jgi:GNAT superfamily N-acetyltransferase